MPIDFNDLPIEIVLLIISFIGLKDFQNLRQTCKRLLEVTELSSTKKRIVLNFENRHISDDLSPAMIFTKSICSHKNVRFKNSIIQNAENFFKNLGPRIKSATFINIKLEKKKLCQIFKSMPNLEKLKLKDVYCENFQIESLINTINIHSLSLINLSSEVNKSFFRCLFTNLVKLQFGFLTSETLEDLNRLIKINSKTITDLSICGNLDKERQLQLTKAINSLRLRKLKLNGNFSTEAILNILIYQKCLQHLDISGAQPDNMTLIMKQIGEQLNELRVLKLTDCNRLCNENVKYIGNLKKLKILHTSQCSRLSDSGVIEAFAQREILNIEGLNMANLNLHTNTIIHCIKMFPNLKILNIGESILDSSYCLLNAICDNLIFLEDLNLNGVVKKKQEIPQGIQNLKRLKRLSIFNCKFSNESLINSLLLPQLKILQIGYNSLITDNGIKNLATNCRSIENLELVACEKLTNNSVDFILTNLLQLRYLNLNYSKRISFTSFNNITKYGPRLKTISIKQNNGENQILFGDLLILID